MYAVNSCRVFKSFLSGVKKHSWERLNASGNMYLYLWLRRRMNVLLICTCNLSSGSKITTQQQTWQTSPWVHGNASARWDSCWGNEDGTRGHIALKPSHCSQKQLLSPHGPLLPQLSGYASVFQDDGLTTSFQELNQCPQSLSHSVSPSLHDEGLKRGTKGRDEAHWSKEANRETD